MIIDYFDSGAEKTPERVFIKSSQSSYTYSEAEAASHAVAHALRDAGLEGKHIGILSANDCHAMIAILGVVRSGSPYVPLSPTDSVESIADFMQTADVEVLICHEVFQDAIEELRSRVPKLQLVIGLSTEVAANAPTIAGWAAEHTGKRVEKNAGADDLAIIKASGGTTGRPKAIMQTHRALEVFYRIINQYCPAQTDDPVHLIVGPLTHAAAAASFAFSRFSMTNVVAEAKDPGGLLAAMEGEKVTHLFLPPTIIYRLLAHEEAGTRDLSKLECVLYGAAPMSSEKLKEGLKLWGPVFVQMYGQSEAPGALTCLSALDHTMTGEGGEFDHLKSAGRPTGACEVALMDDDGNFVAPGKRGEIVCRGELVTPGYYNNPEANAEAHAFGWHHTGDIGVFDKNGYLHVVDRKKDMIISGGFNIYPSELEQVIWAHEAVQECAVVGAPDEDWGELVTAVIELKAGHQATEAEIIELCKTRLGSIKAPKSVMFWDELPRSPVGKVLKKDIRTIVADMNSK